MSEPKVEKVIVNEQWCKLITYSDDTTEVIPYPDHRKDSDPPYDGPPSVYNGGLTTNEQYEAPRGNTAGIFNAMYDKLYED